MNSGKARQFDAIVFDLDGTLWNSTAVVTKAWNEVASRVAGCPRITLQDVSSIMGMPHREIFARLFPTLSPDKREQLAKSCYRQEHRALAAEPTPLYEGVREGLNKLSSRYQLGLVSNCQADYLKIFLLSSGVGSLFKDAECHGNTGLSKDHNIRLLVSRNGFRSAAYVGDTGSDQLAAERAGIVYLHVDYGFGEPVRSCQRFATFGNLVDFLMPSD